MNHDNVVRKPAKKNDEKKGPMQRDKKAPTPRHIEQCFLAHGKTAWFLRTWPVGALTEQGSKSRRAPYICHSWRCPACSALESHILFSRIVESFKRAGASISECSFLVLTLDRFGTLGGKKYSDDREAFQELSRNSRNFLARLNRWGERKYGVGWKVYSSNWVATVEAHRSGFPHVNYIVHNPFLAEYLYHDFDVRRAAGQSFQEARWLGDELREMAVATGWGAASTAEACHEVPEANGLEALSNYVVKLAGEFDQTANEIRKLSQLPLGAPPKTRRCRAGKGFMVPREKKEGITGFLIRTHKDGFIVPGRILADEEASLALWEERELLAGRENYSTPLDVVEKRQRQEEKQKKAEKCQLKQKQKTKRTLPITQLSLASLQREKKTG